MDKVKLTVITPVYNSVQFIEKCITNVIEQSSLNQIEHLIIDGASTDGTISIIQDYAANFLHIRFVSEPDKGQSDAMNKGIALAKGEYISFLNVDDFYETNALKEVLDIFATETSLDFIVGNCNVWNEDGTLFYINRPTKLKTWHLLSGYYLPVNPAAYFYRKNIHDKIGVYNVDNHFNMDVEFLLNASTVTELNYYNKIWGNFRLLPNTKTVSDFQAGNLLLRKQELYDKFAKTQNLKIRLKTYIIKLKEKIKWNYRLIRKKMILPFDMVYWKFKKVLSAK